jgi:Fur family ferric uptake transcriptional regulator
MKAADVLKKNKIKRTSCREGIVEVVMQANKALSEQEIKDQLQGNYDRTTFYRSFKTLEEHRIIHKIVVDNQLVKYALGYAVYNGEEHAHFFCIECEEVKCLSEVPVNNYPLPSGYSDIETDVMIKGICKKCKKESDS